MVGCRQMNKDNMHGVFEFYKTRSTSVLIKVSSVIQLSNIENIDRLEVKVRNRSSEISSERRKTARADSSRLFHLIL